jgi:hypothetical protein
VDGAQIRILEQVDEKGLGGLLQGLDCLALPAEARGGRVGQDIVANLAHEAREGEFEHEEVGRLLVSPDLAQRDRAGFVAVRSAGRNWVASWRVAKKSGGQ